MVTLFTSAATVLLALPTVLAEPASLVSLNARQLPSFDPSNVSSQCLVQHCQALGACNTMECMCTESAVASLRNCYQCSVGAGGLDQSLADAAIDSFIQSCADIGKPVSSSSSSTLASLSLNTAGIFFLAVVGAVALA